MIKGQDIVCFGTTDWDRPWGSRQQIMLRLSAENRVLFVEYQASLLHMLFPSLLFSRIKKLGKGPVKISRNLFVLTLCPNLPFGYYFRFLNRINQRVNLWQVRKAMRKLGFASPVLWTYTPRAADLLGRMNEKLVVYHCIADFSREKKIILRNRTIFSMEESLVRGSYIVLASTKNLYRRCRALNQNTYLLPNAVDDKFFSSFLTKDAGEPEDMTCLKRPRIGMVGYLDGNVLDIGLLCETADRRPEWTFVLIGPVFRHASRLKPLSKRANIHFLPEKKNSDIPRYIKYMDVCIIPYVINDFVRSVSSLKLYEYLALGKPIVCTRLGDADNLGDAVRVSDTREDFIRNIDMSLSEKDERLREKRIGLARENSWDERMKTISLLMADAGLLKEKGF